MDEFEAHRARLIPITGINGSREQEMRATSAFLAVLTAVEEFGRGLLKPLGAPAGRIECFTEVVHKQDGKTLRPDGLIRVTRGKREWRALVEAKTAKNALKREQLEEYVSLARTQGVDAVITISNEVAAMPGTHPTPVDRRRLGSVNLHHLSWVRILTEAVMQKAHRGVSDPDQAWILGELIRYLEHDDSGVLQTEDLGSHWVAVRNAARHGTLQPNDPGVPDVAGRWDQLLRVLCLRMGQRLGADVELVVSRSERTNPATRTQRLISTLGGKRRLDGSIRIPNAIGTIEIVADLRERVVRCSTSVPAPGVGRSKTRVNWLLRQLKSAPDALRIETHVRHGRSVEAVELLSTAREHPESVVGDKSKEITKFRLSLSATMGQKRGIGEGSFVRGVSGLLDRFYSSSIQNLKAWRSPAPKMSPEPKPPSPADADEVVLPATPESA